MKKALLFITVLGLFSCKNQSEADCNTETAAKNEEGFEMYEMSEMAALMEQMYVDNQRLKERIIKGDTIGQFPQHFMRIHSAVLTDETDKDDFFKTQAAVFIKSQEMIYNDPENAKEHFNNGIKACIACHEVKCGGPIPKIKKLYINQ
ncbi:hypothetical protein ACFS5J_04645 [Flavobacterium chuncheonense]|uniref:Cytochrome c n=1 Tax=Flavobacterium chuncheonense TaxID=2026653 RepID=A0ABW5YJQ8_9FLAO